MDGIDEVCRRRFDAHRREGGAEPVESFLPPHESGAYRATLEELLLIDFEFRWKAWCRAPSGSRPSVSDVKGRFPELDTASWARLEDECRWLPAHYEQHDPDAHIGRYALGPRLGQGASAVVFRAHDPDLDRDVALKVTHRDLASSPDRLERVRREAQSAAGLRHPGIVTVHEVGEHDGRPYFALELVEGQTLEDRLADGPLESAAAVALVARIADAVGYAHEMGVVHRDIKPANILLETDGRPRLTDFGLAHLATTAADLTRHGEVLGTPAYMAPEQARGEDVDESADVYALGVLLYELLTGRRPFVAPTAEATLYAVVHDTAASPRSLRRNLPQDLETICQKAMAREPERRYESAHALARDLRAYRDHRPIEARPPGLLERAHLWRRRNPALALSLAGGLVAVLVVGAIGLSNVLRERSRFRHQRDVAERNLVHSLLGEATAMIEARGANWQPRSSELIARAARLLRDPDDRILARTLLARSESAVGPSLRETARWSVGHGVPRALAVSPRGEAVAALTDTGTLWTRTVDADAPKATALEGDARYLAWHDDVLLVAYGSGRLESRDAKTHALRGAADLGSAASALTLHPSLALVAVGLDSGTITLRRLPMLSVEQTLTGHTGGVTALAFSQDGTQLASAGLDLATRFWLWRDGAEQSAATEVDPVRFVAFFGDAWAVTSTAEQYGFRVVDVPAGHTLPTLWKDDHASGPVTSMSATRGRNVVTTSIDGTLSIWSVVRRHGVAMMAYAAHGVTDEGAIRTAAPFPDGRRLAVAHVNGAVSIWDLEASGVARPFDTHQGCAVARDRPTVFGTEYAFDLTAAPGESRRQFGIDPVVAMASGEDGVRVIARRSGQVAIRTNDGEHIVDSGCAPASALVVSGDRVVLGSEAGVLWMSGLSTRGTGRLVEAGIGAVFAMERGSEDDVVVVAARGVAAVSPRGEVRVLDRRRRSTGAVARFGDILAVTAPGGGIELWGGSQLAPTRTLPAHAVPVTGLCLVGAGRSLLSVDEDGTARLLHLASGEVAFTTEVQPGGGCALSADGTFAAVGAAAFLDLESGARFAESVVDPGVVALGDAEGFVLAGARGGAWRLPASELEEALTTCRSQKAKGLDPGSRILMVSGVELPGGHSHRLWSVAASPDGRFVATAGHAGEIALWRATDLAFVRQLRGPGPLSWTVAFSPDSKRVACGGGAKVYVHDVVSGAQVGVLAAHTGLVTSVRYAPHGEVIVTTGSDDTLRLWDADTLKARGRLETSSRIGQTAFAPDGSALVGAGRNGNLYVWDIGSGPLRDGLAPTRQIESGGSVWCVTIDPSSTLLVSGADDGTIHIHDLGSGQRRFTLEGAPRLRNLAFSHDGRYLVGACWAARSTAWDMRSLRARLARLGLDFR